MSRFGPLSRPELSLTTSLVHHAGDRVEGGGGRVGAGGSDEEGHRRWSPFELFDVGDADRLERAVAIPAARFVEEQKVPLELEISEHDRDDPAAVHALALDGSGAAGAARFYVAEPGIIPDRPDGRPPGVSPRTGTARRC